jgi:diacylglycerol kinase family enzyme
VFKHHIAAMTSALVLINRKSGTVRSRGAAAVKALVQSKPAPVYGKLDVELFDGDIIPRAEVALKDRTHDIIVAGGGDGTIASLAGLLVGTDIIMGALPLGTMNLVVQALGFSPELEAALEQFADAAPNKIDVGTANDRVFLHQISFGLQPRMARLREKLGYRSRMGKMMGAARAYLTLAMRPKLVRININIDGEELRVSAPFVAITNNPIDLNRSWSVQHRLDSGVLGYYAVSDISLRSLLRLARSYLKNRLNDDDIFENRIAKAMTIKRRPRRIDFKKRKGILASIDGEVAVMGNPVSLGIKRGALRALSVRAA